MRGRAVVKPPASGDARAVLPPPPRSPFRAVLQNAAYLGSGKVVAALLGLAALALAGRGLPAALFGSLVVVEAYAKSVSGLAKFQTWQFIVRYGTPALTQGDLVRFRQVTGFSFGLDLASSGVALVGGMALLPLLAHAVGIHAEDLLFALFYCTLIPFMTAATPTGVLRVLDRFDLLAVQQAATPVIQAAGALLAFVGGLGFGGFLIAWYLARVLGDLLLWWFAIRELRRRRIHGALRPGLMRTARQIPHAWDFVWTTNFSHSIWSMRDSGSSVIVGIVLGPAAAGVFKIAATFFDSAGTPAGLMNKSLYPEIMRLDPKTKQPWKLAVRASLTAAAIGVGVALLVIFAGRPIIGAVFGARYLEAYVLLKIMTAALVIAMLGFPLESLLYMASRQRAALVAQVLASIVYVGMLIGMALTFGLIGAAIAYVAGQILESLFYLVPTLGAYRRRHTLSYEDPAGAARARG